MVGLLVTLACILLLTSILLTSLNRAMTGEGSALPGTVRSVEDQMHLYALMQGMLVHATGGRDRYLVPSEYARSHDWSLNTTANLYSALIAAGLVAPKQLVAANEWGWVEVDTDYDLAAINPGAGVYWDPDFSADLEEGSNVSFAHLPLFGERHELWWEATMSTRFPLFGNRGPEDGVQDPESYTTGDNGLWGGHLVFGDGHVEFTGSFTPGNLTWQRGGERHQDNIFRMDDGVDGRDAILGFTQWMTDRGPVLQWD